MGTVVGSSLRQTTLISQPPSRSYICTINKRNLPPRTSPLSSKRKTCLADDRNPHTQGALLAGCLASTGAWPDILDNGRSKPWTVRAIWHGGLVFALFGVLVAAQQSMRLHRLSSHRDGYKLIRGSLARAKNRNGWHPHAFQVYAWEVSIVFLVASVFCTVAGLSVLLWVSTAYGPNKPEGTSWWDENSKVCSVLSFPFPLDYRYAHVFVDCFVGGKANCGGGCRWLFPSLGSWDSV